MGNLSKHRKYSLEPYNPKWLELFEEKKRDLTPLFADNLISIEHIGSTSIPGMIAKPNIDILVVVKDLDRIPTQYDAFKTAGYTPLGREYVGEGDEYVVEDTAEGRRVTSIHIHEEGHPKIAIYRNFRNYLIAHPEEKQSYIDLKQQLHQKFSDNYKAYDDGKAELIYELRAKATAWAKEMQK